MEDLRDQEAELAVAEDGAVHAGVHVDLLEDLERGGQRLGEDRRLVAHALGHLVEVLHRDLDVLGEGAVGVEDAHHRPARAVPRHPPLAVGAEPAAEVDLADHALAAPLGRPLDHPPDELVAEHAAEAHVPPGQLQVGAADARPDDADHGGARPRGRDIAIDHLGGGAVPVERTHGRRA